MRTGGRTIRNNVSNCMFRPPSLLGMTITSCGLMEVAVELLLGVPLCCMVLWVAAQMIRILSSFIYLQLASTNVHSGRSRARSLLCRAASCAACGTWQAPLV